MKRLALTVPVALAGSFALFAATGCTIYTYDRPPPAHHKPKPAATAAKTSTGGGMVAKNPRTGQSGGKVAPSDVPTVTSSTLFGGSSVQAFHGFAYVVPEGTSRMPNF